MSTGICGQGSAFGDRDDIRRYVSGLDQTHRLFGHHRDEEAAPETPQKRIGDSRTDEELDVELDALEDKLNCTGSVNYPSLLAPFGRSLRKGTPRYRFS